LRLLVAMLLNMVAFKDAGIIKDEIEAAWVGIYYYFTGMSGATVEEILRLDGILIIRVENYCASGIDAFRNLGGAFSVASVTILGQRD